MIKNKETKKQRKIKKQRKTKKQSTKILIGGWNDTDTDFIDNDRLLGANNLYDFEKKILDDLISYINKKFSKNFSTLSEVLIFIKTLDSDALVDDLDYTLPKISIIPKGTVFYRRQKINKFDSKRTSMYSGIWLDYSGTFAPSSDDFPIVQETSTPFSFLKDTNDKYTSEYLDRTIEKFGEFLMKYKVNKDLLILHFPSYVSAYIEGWVRHICIHTNSQICVDGYTMEFLKYNGNQIYKDLPSLNGLRELCILDTQNVSLVVE